MRPNRVADPATSQWQRPVRDAGRGPGLGRRPTVAPPRRTSPRTPPPDHDAEWVGHLVDPADRERWEAAGLRPSDGGLAAGCIEYGITPGMLSLKLSGATVLARLRFGESVAQVWARIQEAAEAPTTAAEHRQGFPRTG